MTQATLQRLLRGRSADSALQPGDVKSAAHHDVSEFATAAQGGKADTALQSSDVQSAAHHPASDFATAAQGAKADSAVQPVSLKRLAYKDKATVADIDATGTPKATTFLAGDGRWTVFGGAVFNASLLLRYAYGIYRGQPISFETTSQSLMVNALINPDHAINYKLDVTLYVGIQNGAATIAGGCTIYPSPASQPQQYVVFGVAPNLVPGQTYSAYLQVSCMDASANDSFNYNLVGACV
ncbi:hypothetical protein [Brucella pituitosa]|uniref:hypothetical protein n=1 Tax=Brucella pituitosa TaxID=571256 RepID=UPI00126026F4|nr:hypothetical protein [Brucella pituitosa]